MCLTILCGLNEEADIVLKHRHPDVQVLWGPARMNLDNMVARGCKAILSFGISGALHPSLKVGDICIANAVYTHDPCFTNSAWRTRLREQFWLATISTVPFYS